MKQLFIISFFLIALSATAQLPTDGLIAHYAFNNSANDSSSYKNDGQITGAVSPAEDRFGNPCGAFRFLGTDGFISVPNSPSLKSPTGSITITGWLKAEKGKNSSSDINLVLLCKSGTENAADAKAQYSFLLQRAFGDSRSNISMSSDFSFADTKYNNHEIELNKWYFMAVSYDENFVQVYQNGLLICQAPKNKSFTLNDFALEIGRDLAGGKKYFCGCLDDIRIYRRGLSAVEINSLFNEPKPVMNENIVLNLPHKIMRNTERGKCFAVVNFAPPRASSGCGLVELKQVQGLSAGSQFATGTNNLVYEANAGSKKVVDSFQIIISDNEAPVFKCPTDIIAKARTNTNGVLVDYPALSVTDNCPNLKLELLSGLPTGGVFPMGTTEVKYKATDANGNENNCSFKITILDETAFAKEEAKQKEEKAKPVAVEKKPATVRVENKPKEKRVEEPVVSEPVNLKPLKNFSMTCSGDISKKIEAGKCGAVVNYPAPQLTLGGGIAVVQTAGLPSGKFFPYGTTVNTFTAARNLETAKECSFKINITDQELPIFNCPGDTIILIPTGRKGLIYHYTPPVAHDNCGLDTVIQLAGSKDGCFLQIGVHPFIFKAIDLAGNSQICTHSVMVKEDASVVQPVIVDTVPPKKLDTQLNIGTDTIAYEHKAEVNDCYLTIFIYDDGEEDNDSVSIIFNGQVLVNRDMIRIKENGIIKRNITLIPNMQNYIISKAWNTGRYGLNTLRIDVYEGTIEKEVKTKKPVMSKILHSRPGTASGLLLRCKGE